MMNAKLIKTIGHIRSSYWFVPAVMALIALLLGPAIVYVDAEIGSDWLDELSWYQSNKPDGAQEVLATIAGSAITVAGVVFSITIVSVAYAASQYGPRVLTNFMGNRGNQVTLGTFTATFIYCLVVLRTIRGGDDNDFVPDLAIIIALLLALCSIAVLIFFIHHVAHSIHVNTVVAGIGKQMLDRLDQRHPEYIGDPLTEQEERPLSLPSCLIDDGWTCAADDLREIPSPASGYIEAIDDEELLSLASRCKLVLRLRFQPGDFIQQGEAFAEAWPRDRLSDEVVESLQATTAVGTRRTPLQDIRFSVDELVEVGTRALSPSINDPFTAITCLDWLGAGYAELAHRGLPSQYRTDEQGTIRVIAQPLSFEDFVERGFGRFREYLASDSNASIHALETIHRVSRRCRTASQVQALKREAEKLVEAAADQMDESTFQNLSQSVEKLGIRPADASL